MTGHGFYIRKQVELILAEKKCGMKYHLAEVDRLMKEIKEAMNGDGIFYTYKFIQLADEVKYHYDFYQTLNMEASDFEFLLECDD